MPSNIDFMQGWDIIVATHQPQINNGLKLAYDADLIPKNFDLNFKIDFLGLSIKVNLSGMFDVMQMFGGTGTIIDLLLPIKSGSIKIPDGPTFDLAGVKAIIKINLTFVESPVQPVDGTAYDINIDFTNKDAFVSISLENLPPPLSSQQTAISIALTDYLQKETAGQSYTVATVDLGNFVDNPDTAFLVPKLLRYSILTSSQNADDNVLAVLLQTISDKPGRDQILAGTIPAKHQSAVLISNPIFMKNFIAPSIADGFNIQESQLTISGDPTTIVNNGDINTSITTDGRSFDVTIQNLSVNISSEKLNLALKIKYNVSPGIDLIYTISSAGYTFVVEKNGESISLKEENFSSDKNVDIAWWVWVAGGPAAILALPIVGLVVAGIIFGVSVAIVAIIQAIVKDKSPNLEGSIIVDAAKPVKWNFSELFIPQNIFLPRAFQTGGTIPLLSGTQELEDANSKKEATQQVLDAV